MGKPNVSKKRKGECQPVDTGLETRNILLLNRNADHGGSITIGPSLHSRAARRATSPSIDTDKSLKEIQPPSPERAESRPSVLAARQGAGVTKKASKRKTMLSSKARRRLEKGSDKAEAISERVASKIEKSLKQGKLVRSRGKTWDEVNGSAATKKSKKKGQNPPQEEAWETDDEEMAAEDAPIKTTGAFQVLDVAAGDDEDEIL
ncbi:hypothetical protein jhhlp_005875 [Lomentospora prolificans]|uniref:Alb1-domain-containing protein n=1 Tax=Lomentospora prolificans TaxID=41688 RepID=A0A2N3N4B8_9PEZI|nr:hypothetical protein jhhlp_005875 [Lomentospora prolificans]